MATPPGILALVDDPALRDDVDRVSAAAGLPVVHAAEPSRKVWSGAAVILLDAPAARRCIEHAMPAHNRVVLVGRVEPAADDYQVAIAVGARHVLTLPGQDRELMAELADAAETAREVARRGAVLAVISGRGGAGASVFATALARTAAESGEVLLVDVDPWGGGLDLVLGSEAAAGLRWPDLSLRGGRLNYAALRDALPRHHAVSVLSASRDGTELDAAPLSAVVDAGARGGATVVCDVPRRSTPAAETALDSADLVVIVVPAEVRACAAAAAVARWVFTVNPNAGLVVRGPSPGGLRASDVAEIVELPLLATMRPVTGLPRMLECGGLHLRRRSPLAFAARRVLAVLQHHPMVNAA